VVSDDHRAREIAAVLDLSWVHAELALYYSHLGRPSIDPVLMVRMLIHGYGGSDYRRVCPLAIAFRDLRNHVSISECVNFRAHNNERARSDYELHIPD
jgi:hypothetical protein